MILLLIDLFVLGQQLFEEKAELFESTQQLLTVEVDILEMPVVVSFQLGQNLETLFCNSLQEIQIVYVLMPNFWQIHLFLCLRSVQCLERLLGMVPKARRMGQDLFSDDLEHVDAHFKSQGFLIAEIEPILVRVECEPLIFLLMVVSCFDTLPVNSEVIFLPFLIFTVRAGA